MVYVLEAVVAPKRVAHAFGRRFPSGRVAPLADELALVPLTKQVISEIAGDEGWEMPLLFGDRLVPEPLAGVLEDASRLGTVAYFEAEFTGGPGEQASVVWRDGRIVLGPIIEEENGPRRPLREGAFNQALRELGVRIQTGALDEFDTVGLGRCRFTEDWLELAEPSPPDS